MKIKLLIVEDEARALQRYRNYIESYQGGFEIVAEARTFEEAIKAFHETSPDAIFMDIVIPGGDGIELFEAVRKVGWNGVSVIVSGYDKFQYAQKALQLGAADYLLKPIFRNDYYRMLDKVRLLLGALESIENQYFNSSLPMHIQKAMEYVTHNYDSELKQQEIAQLVGCSPSYLSSSFTKYVGISFVDFVKYYRIQVAISILEKSSVDCSLEEVAERSGFCDASYFSHCFRKVIGVSPRRYQIDYYKKQKAKDAGEDKK